MKTNEYVEMKYREKQKEDQEFMTPAALQRAQNLQNSLPVYMERQ